MLEVVNAAHTLVRTAMETALALILQQPGEAFVPGLTMPNINTLIASYPTTVPILLSRDLQPFRERQDIISGIKPDTAIILNIEDILEITTDMHSIIHHPMHSISFSNILQIPSHVTFQEEM